MNENAIRVAMHFPMQQSTIPITTIEAVFAWIKNGIWSSGNLCGSPLCHLFPLHVVCRIASLSLSDAVYAVKQSKASLSQICFWSKQRSREPTRDRVGEAGESSWLCLAPSSGSVFLVRERVGGAGESPLPVRLCLAPSSGSLVCIRAHQHLSQDCC